MPVDENKAIARRFLQAWNAGGLGIVDELAPLTSKSLIYSHFPQLFRGAQAFKEILTQTIRCFPNLQITDDEIVAEGGASRGPMDLHWHTPAWRSVRRATGRQTSASFRDHRVSDRAR